MKRILFFLAFLVCVICGRKAQAQIITTFAGTGSITVSGDNGPATAAGIGYCGGGAFDGIGNYYFAYGISGHVVRMVDTSGIIHTVAGNGSGGYGGDNGPATDAQLNHPYGAVTDEAGNIYIADTYNYRVRKVDAATHIITTIAGNGSNAFTGDGIATANSLHIVYGICLDHLGNVYVLDSNIRVRKISPSGMISTIAGNGIMGETGDGGPATNAKIGTTYGICSDISGNIYFGTGSWGDGIRKINSSNGIITAFAGNGGFIYNGDEINADAAAFNPHHIYMDPVGKMYISDFSNARIRVIDSWHQIHTIAGTGIDGYNGDSIIATTAQIYHPEGVVTDKCGNVFIADELNKRIRKITINPECWPLQVGEAANKTEIVSISPNPAYNEVVIKGLAAGVCNISITNTVGQVVYNKPHSSGQVVVDIQHLVNGIYFVQANGLFVGKFVKE